MSLNKIEVLIIEDDIRISNHLKNILRINDINAIQAFSSKEGLQLITSKVPDVILLDLALPDGDGKLIIKEVRGWSTIPILVISANCHEREKVSALDLGADDYITKPFGSAELLARIRVSLRHHNYGNGGNSDEDNFVNRQLVIDYRLRKIFVRNRDIHFTPIEYKIVCLLAKNNGRVLTHDYIIKNVWGPYVNENHTLRVNMANIRRKIELNPATPEYILTEVGVGYRMIDE